MFWANIYTVCSHVDINALFQKYTLTTITCLLCTELQRLDNNLKLTEVNGNFAFLATAPISSWGETVLSSTHITKNHSEVSSDLMFPFSNISSSLFSISWLHKTSTYIYVMYVYISKQIILTKPWKATCAAIVHANFMLEVCTWRNDNWNACEVPMGLYLKKKPSAFKSTGN